MANKKLTDFDLSTSLQSGDYLVGYKADATGELRTTFQTIQNSLPDLFKYQGTDLKDLSGNWESTYTLVSSNSASWDTSNFLPLSGGDLTGAVSLSNVSVQPGQTITECLSSLVITVNGQQFKVPLLAI